MRCPRCYSRTHPARDRDVLVCELCGHEMTAFFILRRSGSWLGRLWLWSLR